MIYLYIFLGFVLGLITYWGALGLNEAFAQSRWEYRYQGAEWAITRWSQGEHPSARDVANVLRDREKK